MGLVLTEDRGAVRHIVLNRPEKRNALGGDMITELGASIQDAAYDDAVRVVVLRGEGPMFSSGMDVGDLKDLSDAVAFIRYVLALEQIDFSETVLAGIVNLAVLAEDAIHALEETIERERTAHHDEQAALRFLRLGTGDATRR